MNRINTSDLALEDFAFLHIETEEWTPMVQWNSAMLVAHVETDNGPDMRVLRTDVGNGSAYRVNVGSDDEVSESMILIDGDEVIVSLATKSLDNGDASLMVGFEVQSPVRLTASNIDQDPAPTIVLRNYASGSIHVLNGDDESVVLIPGTWSLQATAVPDGLERTGLLTFSKVSGKSSSRRRSA